MQAVVIYAVVCFVCIMHNRLRSDVTYVAVLSVRCVISKCLVLQSANVSKDVAILWLFLNS